ISALTVLGRRRDVMRVGAHAETRKLGIDARAAAFRVLVFLERDAGRAVGEHEAVAVLVPRTARARRIVVALRKRARGTEPAQAERRRRVLGTTGDHEIRIAVLNEARGEPDAVRARRAGRHDA